MDLISRFTVHRGALLRYGILYTYTLLVVHFFIYKKLPFQDDYQFPWFSYLIISLMATFICTVNHWTYRRIPLPKKMKTYTEKVIYQVLLSAVICFISYSFIYLLVNQVIFQAEFNLLSYLRFLAISEAIIIAYVLSITGYKLYTTISSQPTFKFKDDNTILVTSGQKDIQLKINNIVFIFSCAGIVSIHLKNQNRIITQYSSLEEIQEQLPNDRFYRVSRQYLICKEAIKEIRKDRNRKLILQPDPLLFNGHTEEITISRYRSKDFKRWLKGESENPKQVPAI